MNPGDKLTFAVPLWPLPVAILFLILPCLGVTLVIGGTAITVALHVTDLDELARKGGRP